jgi:hypothetical protein
LLRSAWAIRQIILAQTPELRALPMSSRVSRVNQLAIATELVRHASTLITTQEVQGTGGAVGQTRLMKKVLRQLAQTAPAGKTSPASQTLAHRSTEYHRLVLIPSVFKLLEATVTLMEDGTQIHNRSRILIRISPIRTLLGSGPFCCFHTDARELWKQAT